MTFKMKIIWKFCHANNKRAIYIYIPSDSPQVFKVKVTLNLFVSLLIYIYIYSDTNKYEIRKKLIYSYHFLYSCYCACPRAVHATTGSAFVIRFRRDVVGTDADWVSDVCSVFSVTPCGSTLVLEHCSSQRCPLRISTYWTTVTSVN
jgi:hypothetical protein